MRMADGSDRLIEKLRGDMKLIDAEGMPQAKAIIG